MAKEPVSKQIPPVHPALPEVLRRVFPNTFDLNASDRTVGYVKGTQAVIEYLETILDKQDVSPLVTPHR